MGPYVLRLVEDGEIIHHAEVELGLMHRGVEKCFTGFNFLLGNSLADKVDYLAAPACNLAYSLAAEKLSGIDVPEPAQYIRVLLLELNRISSHLFYVAQVARCVGSSTACQFALRECEKFCDIFEMYCGSRVAFNAIRIGGVSSMVTEGILYRIESTLRETENFLLELNRILSGNPVFQHRLRGLAPISKQMAIDGGISGPNARSAGLNQDLRHDRPYAAYDRVNFEPSYIQNPRGDGLDRFHVRLREIHESCTIIEKIIRRIPGGNHNVPIGADFAPPKGDSYVEIEGPRGAIGVYLETQGAKKPSRVKFMAPSMLSLRMVSHLLREEMTEDAELVIAGLDISFSEVDR